MDHKLALCAYFKCIFQPFTDELHPCSYTRRSTVIGFRKRCFVLVHSEVCCGSVRFFEYTVNSDGGERLHREGETSCSRGETGDIIFTEWNLRFIQNVASCYCLTKESVITATLVHTPMCVCVPRAPHGGLSDTSALEISSGGGSGLNSLPIRIRTLRSPVLESGGRVEKLIAQVAWSPVLSFHSLWWFGCNSSAGGPFVFFENQRHCTRLPRHFGALHASFCWPAF